MINPNVESVSTSAWEAIEEELAHDERSASPKRRGSRPRTPSARDIKLARLVLRRGGRHGLRILWEARKNDVAFRVALGVCEQESGFRGIYGHDAVRNRAPKGRPVTRRNYQTVYLPDRKNGLGMQGVREFQLTWWEFQDRADRLGGCWQARWNIAVGLQVLGKAIKKHGKARRTGRLQRREP